MAHRRSGAEADPTDRLRTHAPRRLPSQWRGDGRANSLLGKSNISKTGPALVEPLQDSYHGWELDRFVRSHGISDSLSEIGFVRPDQE